MKVYFREVHHQGNHEIIDFAILENWVNYVAGQAISMEIVLAMRIGVALDE